MRSKEKYGGRWSEIIWGNVERRLTFPFTLFKILRARAKFSVLVTLPRHSITRSYKKA